MGQGEDSSKQISVFGVSCWFLDNPTQVVLNVQRMCLGQQGATSRFLTCPCLNLNLCLRVGVCECARKHAVVVLSCRWARSTKRENTKLCKCMPRSYFGVGLSVPKFQRFWDISSETRSLNKKSTNNCYHYESTSTVFHNRSNHV